MKTVFPNLLTFVNQSYINKWRDIFESKGIIMVSYHTLSDYIKALETEKITNNPSISLIELTNQTNLNVISELIQKYPQTRFFILTSSYPRLSIQDIYNLLIIGAADVLSIDTSPQLIYAKVIANMRNLIRSKIPDEKLIKTTNNDIILDTEFLKLIIKSNQKEYKLTKKQSTILAILIKNENKIVERHEIAMLAYSDKIDKTTPQIIDKHIQMIRDLIPEISKNIKTVYGKGYIFET